jgi:RimJ/RimL family protein N-acetyltransferase
MNPEDASLCRDDVQLDPLRVEHGDAMYAWMKDPEVKQNIGLKRKSTSSRTKSWIRSALEDETTVPFAVLLSGKYVGNVVLDKIDRDGGTARLSLYIGQSSARQRGVGLTASYLAIRHGFECMGLRKIWLTVHAEHFRAIKTYRRLGFSLERTVRDDFLLGQRRIPNLYMGLSVEEFQKRSRAHHCQGEEDPLRNA